MIGSLCKDSAGYFVVLSVNEQSRQYWVCSKQSRQYWVCSKQSRQYWVKTISKADHWCVENSEICDINGN
jgi:hypothetical protein